MKSSTTILMTSMAVLVALLSSMHPAYSQVSTGVVLGAVHDPSGAAVPGAEVTLTARKTGITSTTITGPEGGYVFPQVAVGEYTLAVALTGFRRHERTGLVVNVNQKARMDVTLELGQMTDSVMVAAAAPLVNSVDGETGQTVVQKNIVDLPLKGRQFLELAFLTTGAVNAPPADVRVTFQSLAPAVNGNSPEHNSYTLNGATNRQMHNGFFGVVPSVDSVEEFKIQSGSFNAEYGQAGGAIVNVVTKSGSNAFHGNVYEFLRNDVLNARNFFNPARSQVRQNQFGATLGGPILRNQTFFFFTYEGFRERRASTRSSRFPTPKQLSGDFSGEPAVRDPLTGQPFPDNIIPEARIDPISRKYAAFFPATNPALTGSINYINNRPLSFDTDSYGVRVDHRFSDKNNIFATFNWDSSDGITPGPVFPSGPGDLDIGINNGLFNFTYNRIFSPTSINELRLSYLRFNHLRLDAFKGRDFPTELGLTGITSDPFIRNRFPDVSFGGGYTGLPRSVDQGWIDNIYQIQDNFSWVRPRHSMKFGFGFVSPRNVSTFIANAPVSFGFSGRFSTHAIADFLLAHGDSTSTFLQGGTKHVNNHQLSFYGQDQWQVTSRFTLTYGLRYELHTPYIDPAEEASSVNTVTGALRITKNANITEFQKFFTYPIERLSDRNLYDTHACCLGPLMPRFGFAWRVPGQYVLRGGYALSLNTEVGNMLNGALAAPAWIRTGLTETVFPGIGYNNRRSSLANMYPVGIQPIEDDFREGYTQNWNFTVEKELASNDLLSLAYVGSKGTHLLSLGLWNEAPPGPGSIDLRRPFPQFGTATLFSGFGASNYHSLQAKVERRFAAGLGYLTGYTYSRGLGNTSTVNEARVLTGTDLRSGRGRLGFDVRQRFTAAVVYEFPFGPGKRFLSAGSGWKGAIAGGWQVNTITAFQTGYPINLGVTPCQLNGYGNRCVPNLDGPDHGNLPRDVRSVDRWFNAAAFSAPAPFTQGNQQQYTLDGPGINNWDTSFVKNTRISESMNLQFRAEFFNLFNHTRFSGVGTTLGATTFGRVLSSTGEREVQLALKLYF